MWHPLLRQAWYRTWCKRYTMPLHIMIQMLPIISWRSKVEYRLYVEHKLLDSMFMIILGLERLFSSICTIVWQKERRYPWLYLDFKSQGFSIISLKIEILFEHFLGIIYVIKSLKFYNSTGWNVWIFYDSLVQSVLLFTVRLKEPIFPHVKNIVTLWFLMLKVS